jgi:hypothetical protein
MALKSLLQEIQLKIYRCLVKNPWEARVESEVNKIHEVFQREAGSDNSEVIKNVVDTVSTKGYMLFSEIISDETLDKLRSEYHSILTSDVNTFRDVDRHDGAVCVRMQPFFKISNFTRYPATSAFFNANLFYEITEEFYAGSKGGFGYMTEIFVHDTPETNTPLSEKLHWDRAQTLKFWIYLDDVPAEAGAMRIEPDSVERNKKIRIDEHDKKGVLIGGVENIVELPVIDPIALAAPAGSILIHDTDASHGSHPVMQGYTRKIMRGHCRAKSFYRDR